MAIGFSPLATKSLVAQDAPQCLRGHGPPKTCESSHAVISPAKQRLVRPQGCAFQKPDPPAAAPPSLEVVFGAQAQASSCPPCHAQGSATPTKYQKLCDNSDLTTDTLQQWTYNLSHMYFNWYAVRINGAARGHQGSITGAPRAHSTGIKGVSMGHQGGISRASTGASRGCDPLPPCNSHRIFPSSVAAPCGSRGTEQAPATLSCSLAANARLQCVAETGLATWQRKLVLLLLGCKRSCCQVAVQKIC